ncbi:MAG: iron ABC transporter permease [Peptococcaceae bacterium]|nr:iron ABC transporter permease [Peptococcaceae bacterium]
MRREIILAHREKEKQRLLVLLLLILLLVAGCLIFTSLGVIKLPPWEIARIILTSITSNGSTPAGIDEIHRAIILDIRLPRILAAVLVGAGLATAGAVFQGLLMNPLADPYTLGISTGAAFGATLAMFFGVFLPGGLGLLTVPLLAFAGALLALGAVYGLAVVNGTMAVTNLILSGVIVSAILSAAISFLKSLAGEGVGSIVFWLMGSFASRGWHHVFLCLPVVLAGLVICCYYADDLNILSLGSKSARQLGVDDSKVITILLVTSSLVTAACVSISGIIGFVGLIVPHLMRMLVGPDHRFLIPVSALGGALLLVGADTIARNLLAAEIPVGVLTTLLGGPFFCYIFRIKAKRQIF